MEINNIKTPDDILEYLKENIKYGWVGSDGIKRVNSMEGFRTYYRTSSIENTLKEKVGTCVEQVCLMNYFLNKLNIESKMFCTRLYEDEAFNDLEAPERMHCFILYYVDDEVYQMEHPDPERVRIWKYKSEDAAIKFLESRYEKMTKEDLEEKGMKVTLEDIKRTTTRFYDMPEGLSYKELNLYINKLK